MTRSNGEPDAAADNAACGGAPGGASSGRRASQTRHRRTRAPRGRSRKPAHDGARRPDRKGSAKGAVAQRPGTSRRSIPSLGRVRENGTGVYPHPHGTGLRSVGLHTICLGSRSGNSRWLAASPARLNACRAWQPRSARHAVETGILTAFNYGSDRTGGRADGSAGASAAYEFRRTLERPHPWRPGIVPGADLSLWRADRERAGLLPRVPAPTSSAASRRAGR